MPEMTPPSQEFLAQLVEPYLATQPTGLGFAIGIIGPDFQQNWQFGSLRNQFGNELAFNIDTPFEIASITKTFTATLYVLSRIFSPNDTLSKYILPLGPLQINHSLADITLDGLVNYTSGLPQDNFSTEYDTPNYTPQPYFVPAMMSYLLGSPPVVAPDKVYTYSNLAFALMAVLLAATSDENRSFQAILKHNLLERIGMNNTFLFDDVNLNELPQGFNYSSRSNHCFCAPGYSLFPAYNGCGGLVTTSRDLLTWLSFNMGRTKSPLTPCIANTQVPVGAVTLWGNTQIGRGWFITSDAGNGLASIWKDGELNGFSSYIALLPSDNPGVEPSPAGAFVLVNASGLNDSNGVEAPCSLANDILLNMLGRSLPVDKTVYPSSKRLSVTRS